MYRSLLNRRDNEKAYVTVNDQPCWSQEFFMITGSQQCGSTLGNWNENSISVKCEAEAVDGKLAVRVYADLDGSAEDESFAIDNVVITKIGAGPYFCFTFRVSLMLPLT